MMPFSSKSAVFLKVKGDFSALAILTKLNELLSKSYHCLATWRVGRPGTNQSGEQFKRGHIENGFVMSIVNTRKASLSH